MCNENKITQRDALELAWKYFQQHAQQRLYFFNFFVILSALLTTGLITTFQPTFHTHIVGIVIGLMQAFIAFLFWKIDERNKYLTKHGEDAIKELEARFDFIQDSPENPSPIKLFTSEKKRTDNLKAQQTYADIWARQLSHSKSFNTIFVVFGLVGLLCAGLSGHHYLKFEAQQRISRSQEVDGHHTGSPLKEASSKANIQDELEAPK